MFANRYQWDNRKSEPNRAARRAAQSMGVKGMITEIMTDARGQVWAVELVRNYVTMIEDGVETRVPTIEIRNLYRRLRYAQPGSGGFTVYRESCHGPVPHIVKEKLLDVVAIAMHGV